MVRLNRRNVFLGGIGFLILLALMYGFRSPPVLVDNAIVTRGHFRVMVEEEGRTRLPDRYQVSAPITGYLNRVLLEPGDAVQQGSPLFTINPTPTTPLDARSRAQAEAALASTEAALEAALTQVESEQARAELADTELTRVKRLVAAGHMPVDNLDRAQAEARRADAALRSSRFAAEVARHERDNARATLAIDGGEQSRRPFAVAAPVGGLVLARQRQSEGMVQAGDPILMLGDLASLEVEVDVLSPDAVRLTPGMRVELERWGGEASLPGRVRRIDPAGFTRYSALGVEEQRVWVIVDIDAEREHWATLGDGYRVEASFILWEGDDVLQIPASAIFREGNMWALYVIEDGRAQRREIIPGRRSGLMMEIVDGLAEGETAILYPGQDIAAGTRVRLR
ncbi:efflux RND transporter periplasmic adaptor subunit [Cellvibrio sp. PSBB006]|uniref:efflux RND transporter periplasmic adaptor subunit n=1 Tax=Cellvibrio sp. PSBB006 TaxID=1987723 RepID=UPI000B3B98E0|nr:HlyD family efflux transporter periplasmic adaptor subunit [Cellvibrio sp. PSBB006]ARU26185.1 hypothetical protein CBR65_01355 [Cellvibrio sp. PSBB006]